MLINFQVWFEMFHPILIVARCGKLPALRRVETESMNTFLGGCYWLSPIEISHQSISKPAGDKAKETLIRMLPSMMAPQSLMHVARNTDTLKDASSVMWVGGD